MAQAARILVALAAFTAVVPIAAAASAEATTELDFVVPIAAAASAEATSELDFTPIKAFLSTKGRANTWGHNISFTVGTLDSPKPLFSYTNGNMSLYTKRVLGSGSKWAASTAMLALVHAANASVDDKMSKYLDWWTTDAKDPRSNATLRHFLTMTSGMVTDGTDGAVALNNSDAKRRVAHSKLGYGATASGPLRRVARALRRRDYFMYGTLTFNFVAAAMEVAHGEPIESLLETYFLGPLNMTGPWSSRVSDDEPAALATTRVPLLGGGLAATAAEMDGFMARMLRKDFLPGGLHDVQEAISTSYAQYSTQNQVFGPYGMGIWHECLMGGFNPADPFPASCAEATRITHPGCYGYWNYVSRPKKYYFNFLPSYTCDASNAYCGYGEKPPGGESCPAITWSETFRLEVGVFLEDLFA
ncbi:beta-lactamase [Aureococcus anophagefferens]|nr:beta-lactamase [Aureococcus anophagefferens]